jgi:hypothetical protein
MSKDQALGVVIVGVCLLSAFAYYGFLFLYEPFISPMVYLGSNVDVRFWLIAAPVAIVFEVILAMGLLIGYTMATIPTTKTIYEIPSTPKGQK